MHKKSENEKIKFFEKNAGSRVLGAHGAGYFRRNSIIVRESDHVI